MTQLPRTLCRVLETSHLLQIQHFIYPEVPAAVACRGCPTSELLIEQCSVKGPKQETHGSPSTGQDRTAQQQNLS